jgi:tetratricopeptide (TPR) repeat protein
MSCLFIALEGLTSAALATARAAGAWPSLERLAAAGQVADMTFPLADARVATLASAMTGTWPDQHGILTAQTADAPGEPLRPVSAADRAQPAIWETLDAQGVDCVSVGWPLAITGTTARTALVAAGFGCSPGPGFVPEFNALVQPADLTSELGECWLRPEELGADTIAALAPGWQQVNQEVDHRLAALGAALAENVSRHAAFLALLETRPWQCATLCLSLPAELASLERASEPLADDLFAGLGRRALPLLDAILAEILRRMPPGCAVIIAGLPHAEQPAAPGFVLLHGEAFQPAALRALTVLDLAPVVWRACGLSAAKMPGRGLLPAVRPTHPCRAFDRPWNPPAEHRPLDRGRLLVVGEPIVKWEGERLEPGEFWHYHTLSVLGRSLMAHDEWQQALPVLDALTRLAPHDRFAWCHLAECQRLLGLFDEALESAHAAVHAPSGGDPMPLLVAAELEAVARHPEAARQLLQRAAPALAHAPACRLLHAKVLIALSDWTEAVEVLATAAREMPHEALPHLLRARCYLALQKWQEAFDAGLQAGNLDAGNPLTHEFIGHALVALRMEGQAWKAFETAAALRPQWPRPWAKLAMLARRMGKPQQEIDRLTEQYWTLKRAANERRQARRESAVRAVSEASGGAL